MSQFSQQFIMALPSLLLISAIVTWLAESIKPTLAKFNLNDTAYGIVLRVIAAVLGVAIAGLLGNPNVFEGVVFYGAVVPPIAGMLITAVLTSAGSNALHEIGEYLNTRPTTNIAATDSNIAISDKSNGDTQPLTASSAARSQPYQRRE